NSARSVSYISKIKLDGTCAAIQVHPNGELVVQSRTEIITPSKDNNGFARWVNENKSIFQPKSDQVYVIFGEWCGSGIQKRCSISKIDRKVFCVFAIQHDNYLEI